MSDQPGADLDDRQLLHQFKNHLAVIVGFCDLMLTDLPGDAPQHRDVVEVRKAAQSAMGLLPEIARRLA
jgi:hypothetical protein